VYPIEVEVFEVVHHPYAEPLLGGIDSTPYFPNVTTFYEYYGRLSETGLPELFLWQM
jgi:hypothetical protein